MTNKRVNRPRTQNRRYSHQKNIPPMLWFAFGVAAGLVIAIILQLLGVLKFEQSSINTNDNRVNQPSQTDLATEIQTEANQDQSDDGGKPVFEFYERLPSMEVEVPEAMINPREEKKIQYLLQAGSFKQSSDAETLKAKLAFVGIVAEVKSVTVNQNKWYRVSVGPFLSKRKTESIQRKLHEQGVDSILLSQTLE